MILAILLLWYIRFLPGSAPVEIEYDSCCMLLSPNSLWRLWAEIEAHKWRDLELNLSKTVEELRQDSQLIKANSMKKLRDNKKLLECSFA